MNPTTEKAVPCSLDPQTLQEWALGYERMLPFAELWETYGLPVDLIGLSMEEKGMLDYVNFGETRLRKLFLDIIKTRDLVNQERKKRKSA